MANDKQEISELEPWQTHERRLLEVMMESVEHDVDKMDAWLKLYIAARDSHTETSLGKVREVLRRIDDQLMRIADSPDAILNDIADILAKHD